MLRLQEKADAADLAKADAPKAEPEAVQKPMPKVRPSVMVIPSAFATLKHRRPLFAHIKIGLWHREHA